MPHDTPPRRSGKETEMGKSSNDRATVIAFKGFDKDFKCRGFQFEVGKTYEHKGEVEHCSSGFHACESPLDVWGYYGPFDSRFAVVELAGELSREEGGDSNVAAGKITIKAELKLPEFIGYAVNAIIDACKGSDDDQSGDYAQIGSSGDSARIGSSGNYAQIGSSGNSARIGSSGDSAKIKAEGRNAVIACAGSVEAFEVGDGGCICIPYHDGERTRFAVGYVGESLKAGVRYTVSAEGRFVEAE